MPLRSINRKLEQERFEALAADKLQETKAKMTTTTTTTTTNNEPTTTKHKTWPTFIVSSSHTDDDTTTKEQQQPQQRSQPIVLVQNLHLAFMGDSLSRYQYINLIYYLQHHRWMELTDQPNLLWPFYNYHSRTEYWQAVIQDMTHSYYYHDPRNNNNTTTTNETTNTTSTVESPPIPPVSYSSSSSLHTGRRESILKCMELRAREP
jgi:hypothetical protein